MLWIYIHNFNLQNCNICLQNWKLHMLQILLDLVEPMNFLVAILLSLILQIQAINLH